MTTETFELFFALLTVATLAATAALVAVRIVALKRESGRELLRSVAATRMVICAAITTTSMLGSLYFSEVANFVPCTLCWYQRIAMYPLAILTAMAAVRKDDLSVYIRVIASIGLVISAYHWLLERFPNIDAGVCSTAIPCELVWFEKFGFITLPFMAFTAFAAVLAVTTFPPKGVTDGQDPNSRIEP
jgi:disulfide bond formation protein DsbB